MANSSLEGEKFTISTSKKHWPLITAVGMFWAAIAICFTLSMRQTQGHLVYALDDPYIHMAMAKNFAQHGVWGVTQDRFTSSSSSLLWTLCLSAAYFLFRTNEASPLILNVVFATLICVFSYIVLRKCEAPPFFIFVVLLLIVFSAPLPSLVFCGQEHTLHTLVTMLFVYLSAKILSNENATRLRLSLLLILAPLLTMARYEGLFLLLVVGCLFAVRRRPLYALSLSGLGILPIVAYGLFSVSKGWYFLPNSVLLKGYVPDFASCKGIIELLVFGRSVYQILHHPHISILIFGALIVFLLEYGKQQRIWKSSILMIIIFITSTFLHTEFASIGWFYRYEAYLVGLGILVIGISLREYLPHRLQLEKDKKSIPQYVALTLIILLIASSVLGRGILSLIKIAQATKNIYEQQYQMGLFLREFYQGEPVAANDIGAINYLADVKCLDLAGLGSLEVGRAKREGPYPRQQIHELVKSKHIGIAIVYDSWFAKGKIRGLLSPWVKVGQWRISRNVVCGSDTVSFYAVDSSQVDNLIENLSIFSARLPRDVVQTGEYTKRKAGDARRLIPGAGAR